MVTITNVFEILTDSSECKYRCKSLLPNQSECKCPFLDQCDFVKDNETKIPELIQRTRQRYCCNHPERCARHNLYETIDPDVVPPLMLPDQHEWARQIIEEYRHGKSAKRAGFQGQIIRFFISIHLSKNCISVISYQLPVIMSS